MCIFTQPVAAVAGTKIFARCEGREQLLAYEMSFAAAGDLAMVLPLPVAPGSGEAGLRFIDLSGIAASPFPTLEGLFPEALPMAFGAPAPRAQTLTVHRVGAFDASFVPTSDDFGRLDRRFRLPPSVWARLPQYADFGFAVFKLHGEGRGLVDRLLGRRKELGRTHPMGLAFRSRDPERLFFPTVHVHDGEVHDEALYDHVLYGQLRHDPVRPAMDSAIAWYRAPRGMTTAVAQRTSGMLDPLMPVFRLEVAGRRPNVDILAEVAPLPRPRRATDSDRTAFAIERVAVTGALAVLDTAIGRLLEERHLDALRRAHERHVAGWLGPTWLWLDVDERGRVTSIAAECAHDAPALVDELRAVLAEFEVPETGSPLDGRIFLSCGFVEPPRDPAAG